MRLVEPQRDGLTVGAGIEATETARESTPIRLGSGQRADREAKAQDKPELPEGHFL